MISTLSLKTIGNSQDDKMIIQPQLLSLNQLLKERLFRIPEYERSYSWKSKHRADLFSDMKTGLHQAVDVAERIPTWDRKAVIERENEIIAWAASYWAD
jgi:hypothetical protein